MIFSQALLSSANARVCYKLLIFRGIALLQTQEIFGKL
jgi:hypothetical protein